MKQQPASNSPVGVGNVTNDHCAKEEEAERADVVEGEVRDEARVRTRPHIAHPVRGTLAARPRILAYRRASNSPAFGL